MSMFGTDLFKVMRFVMAILKLLAEIFGDEEDMKKANDNGF